MPRQLYFSKTICCSFFFLKVKASPVFSAVLQISKYSSQLWGCTFLIGIVNGERTGSAGWKIYAITLRTGSVLHPCSPPTCMSTLLYFPGLWWKSFLPAATNHPRADIRVWTCSSGLCFSSQRWWGDEMKRKKNKTLNLPEDHSIPWRAMWNASCAGLRIAFFAFPQWDCGKGVFNINVPFGVTAFSMVYQLSCLD